MRKNIIIFSLVVIILGGAIGAGSTLPRTFHTVRETESSLVESQSLVLAMEDNLATTRNNLASTVTALSGNTTYLEESQQQIASLTAYLALIQGQLADSENQLNQTQSQLVATQSELTTAISNAGDEEEEATSPRPFNSVQEAQEWLDSHHLPCVLIAGQNGSINLFNPGWDPRYDCDDYARDYQQLALESGYIINLCPVANGQVWGIKVCNFVQSHIGCWVQIDDVYYYVECVPGYANSFKLTRIISAD
jgi:hypothetical protein